MLLEIGTFLGQAALRFAGQQAIGKIKEFLSEHKDIAERAIEATANESSSANVSKALKIWSESDEFGQLIEAVFGGVRPTPEQVVQSFIDVAWKDGDPNQAVEIVASFLDNLVKSFLKSEESLTTLSNRIETRFWESDEHTYKGILAVRADIAKVYDAVTADKTGSTSPDPLEAKFDAQVDVARDLIRSLKSQTAYEQLLRIRGEVIASGLDSKELNFRIATNLGAALLNLDRVDEAKKEIELAWTLDEIGLKANSNMAMIRVLDNRFDEALAFAEKALGVDPKDSYAASMYVAALWETDRAAYESYVAKNHWLLDELQTAVQHARLLAAGGDLDGAEKLARTSCEQFKEHDSSFTVHFELADILYKRLQDDDRDVPLYTDSERLLIQEIIDELSVAIEVLKNSELRHRLQDALIKRGACFAMLFRFKEAISDTDSVLVSATGAARESALWNKGLYCISTKQLDDAVSALKQVTDPELNPRGLLPLAHCYLGLNRADLAVDTLKPVVAEITLDSWSAVRIVETFMEAEKQTGPMNLSTALLDKQFAAYPTDPYVLTALGNLARLQGDLPRAKALWLEARAYADSVGHTNIDISLGELCLDLEEYEDAAEYLGNVTSGISYSPMHVRYLIALAHSKAYLKALDVCATIRKHAAEVPVQVFQVEASVYESIGDLPKAISAQSELCAARPDHAEFKGTLAMMYFRKGDTEQAAKVIDSLKTEELLKEPRALMSVAQVEAFLKRTGFLEKAYLARMVGEHDADLHLAYFALFHSVESTWTEPTVCGPDCAVRLKNDQRSMWIIVGNDGTRLPSELKPEDDLAQRLAGKKAGDEVVLREGQEELSYRIEVVQSKYVRAFQQTAEEFTTLFPSNLSFMKISIAGDDVSTMLAMVEQRSQFVRQVDDYYERGQISMASFSKLIGMSTPEVWYSKTRQGAGKVVSSRGASDDLLSEKAALKEAKTLVLDLSALMTVDLLGVIEPLKARFERVLVPQQVRDELQQLEARTVFPGKVDHVMTKTPNGAYALLDVGPEEQKAWTTFLSGLRGLLEALEIVGTPKALELGEEETSKWVERLGQAGAGAVLAASNEGALLLSDDLVLRRLAHEAFAVTGTGIQRVLDDLVLHEHLSADAYCKAIELLAKSNYWFLNLGPATLEKVFATAGYSITEGVTKVVEQLKAPDCDANSAVMLVADTISLVWRSTCPPAQKWLFLDLLLAFLFEKRNAEAIAVRLNEAIAARLKLNPLVLSALQDTIEKKLLFSRSPFRR